MKRYISVFLIIIFSLPILTSCWSKKELNDLALVSAVALDLDNNDRYIGTFQFINPGNVTGGFQGGGGGQGNAVSVYTAKGDNMDEVSRRMSTKVSRNLYYAHANLVIISEELAKKKGILPILDAFDRDASFRNTATVVISHHAKAADLVKTLTAIDKLPANKMIKLLRFSERVFGGTINVMIMDVIKDLTDDGKQPVISGFNLKGSAHTGKTMQNVMQTTPESAPQIGGLALFKDGKLTGWLYGRKARGAVWTLNKIKKTEVNINKKGKKAAVVLEVIRQNTKISASTTDGRAHLKVKVETEGNIGETKVPVNLKDPMVIKRLEYSFEKAIEKDIKSAITVAQKKKTDIFGFGDAVHRTQPKIWKNISSKWDDEYFAKAKVDVEVDAYVRRTALRNNSFLSDVK